MLLFLAFAFFLLEQKMLSFCQIEILLVLKKTQKQKQNLQTPQFFLQFAKFANSTIFFYYLKAILDFRLIIF